MRNFIKKPAPPTGDDPSAVWGRLYQKYVEQYLPKNILGANWKPDANGGGSYLLPPAPPAPAVTVPEVMFPFKIYKPKQAWVGTSGWIFDESGVPQTIAIDSTVPTNLPTTVNPTTDWWRFYAVRTGLVSLRSYLEVCFDWQDWQPGSQGTTIDADFGLLTEVINGCDGVGVGLQSGVPYDADLDDYPAIKISPLILPASFAQPIIESGTLNGLAISVLRIEETPGQPPNPALQGFVFDETTDYASVFNSTTDSVAFPIGVISALGVNYTGTTGSAATPTCFNLQFGNIIGRYGAYDQAAGGPGTAAMFNMGMNYRGNFLNDSDLADLVFYPGDVVTVQVPFAFAADNGTNIIVNTSFYNPTLYFQTLWMQTTVGYTDDPTTDPDWACISGVFLSSRDNGTPNT